MPPEPALPPESEPAAATEPAFPPPPPIPRPALPATGAEPAAGAPAVPAAEPPEPARPVAFPPAPAPAVGGVPPLPAGLSEPLVLQEEASKSAIPKLKVESLVMTKNLYEFVAAGDLDRRSADPGMVTRAGLSRGARTCHLFVSRPVQNRICGVGAGLGPPIRCVAPNGALRPTARRRIRRRALSRRAGTPR